MLFSKGNAKGGPIRVEDYTRDLTIACKDGKLFPVFGREAYVIQAINALADNEKQGLLITGPPGCGMKSLVRAVIFTGQNTMIGRPVLSKRIVEFRVQDFPDAPKELRSALRDAFVRESEGAGRVFYIPRLDWILSEDKRGSIPRVVREALEEALEEQQIRCIFTLPEALYTEVEGEFRSLLTRVQVLPMQPATASETRVILKRLEPLLSRKYEVRIHPKTLRTALKIAEEYVHDSVLPGSAVALLNHACERYLKKQRSVVNENDAVDKDSLWKLGDMVMSHDVKRAASEILKIDVLTSEIERWSQDLSERMGRRIFGQDEAVDTLVGLCSKLRNGIDRRSRVSSAWLLAGPSHVGKTTAAGILARELLGSRRRLIRVDLSKFSTPEQLRAALWDNEDAVARRLKENKFNIVLFQKLGQAHPAFLDFVNFLFSNWTQGPGKTLPGEFKRAIFLFSLDHIETDELVVTDVEDLLPFGTRNNVIQKLVPTTIHFDRLDEKDILQIIDLYVAELNTSLIDKQIRVELARTAYEFVTRVVVASGNNTRGLKGQLTTLITQPIQDFYGANTLYRGDVLRLHMNGTAMSVSKAKVMDHDTAQDTE